jgi:hypothetical protein
MLVAELMVTGSFSLALVFLPSLSSLEVFRVALFSFCSPNDFC